MPKNHLTKTKILILDQANFIGGAELFTIDLINSLDHNQFEIHLASSNHPEYLKRITPQITTHLFNPPSLNPLNFKSYLNFYKSIQSLKQIVRDSKVDIIHSNTIRTHLISSFVKIKTLIWFVHDFTFPKSLCYFLSSRPKHIICCSNSVKQNISHKIPKKNHYKLQIISNGITLIQPKEKQITETKKVGIVGRIDWWKGQKEFILAAQQVLQTLKDTHFYIIGAPNNNDSKTQEYFQEIKTLSKTLKINNQIHFCGYEPNILQKIHDLDLLVHASVDLEPFGRVIIEAMSQKTPVIASTYGGGAEIIEHNSDGILVNPKNTESLSKAIIKLLTNDTLRNKLIRNAYNKVKSLYSLNKTTQEIERVWKDL